MKQKIFSLLLLMLATTGAWADPTYSVKYTMGNHDVTKEPSATLGEITSANISDAIKAAYISGNQDNYSVDITDVALVQGPTDITISGNTVTLGQPFNTTAVLQVSFKITDNKGTVDDTDDVLLFDTSDYLYINVYHEAHSTTSTTLFNDGDYHWNLCNNTNGQCKGGDEAKIGKAEHVYDNTATDAAYWTCSECNYVNETRKAAAPHTHVFEDAWTTSDTHHYHKCVGTIGACTLDYTDPSALPAGAAADEHVYGTSQDGAAYYTCSVCKKENATRKAEEHNHNYVWKKDNDQHWQECDAATGACTAPIVNKSNHNYGVSGDARWTCQTADCGFVNNARKEAIQNADAAAAVKSWSWDYEIPFDFEGPVLNDRKLNAGQCYTVCLPYALPLNGLKAYYIEQSSDKLVGFHEQSITTLPALQPCVIKADATGNPLSVSSVTVNKTVALADRGAVNATNLTNHSFIGSLKYIAGTGAKQKYILQGKDDTHPEGSFKQIPDDLGDYTDVNHKYCILPMRAYIQAASGGGARMFLDVVFYAADGSTTAVERIAIDQDAAPVIFDLQGRRVQNPRKGGLYIINGRKGILK